jgi:hypothetical protein
MVAIIMKNEAPQGQPEVTVTNVVELDSKKTNITIFTSNRTAS